jgi:hypothetical protein
MGTNPSVNEGITSKKIERQNLYNYLIDDPTGPEGVVPWYYDRVALWLEIGSGAEPWRLDGLPPQTTDVTALAFWYECATIVLGARNDAKMYVDGLPLKERQARQNAARIRLQQRNTIDGGL